ncbi:NAD(P)H-binding protein [Kribbella sp. NPDC004536]|uniref:NmrA family NAD(P)-binding protein n=1 Tax=Kribbella sp. NPDC004536 TaxID=3364106 RepID=UPI0036A6CFAC
MGNTYAVCGARGRVGGVVARQLLAAGHTVRVVTRDPNGLGDLVALGAQVRAGSLRDREHLTELMRGVDAVFVLTPVDVSAPDVNAVQRAVVDATAAAIRDSAVPRVVLLSSWGAELTEPVGGIIACHWFEQVLDEIDGLHRVHLRPVWFMENFLWNIALIKSVGINGSTVGADKPIPAIATPDIAAVAVDYLRSLTFEGRTVHYLNGARDYTMTEVTRILGESIGRPDLRYFRLTDDVLRKGMVNSGGLTPDAARLVLQISGAMDTGMVHAEPRSPHNTTPTTLEQFAETTFAPMYRAAPDASWRDKVGGALLRSYLTASQRRPA